jgi:phosphate transport system substrate-binding protein
MLVKIIDVFIQLFLRCFFFGLCSRIRYNWFLMKKAFPLFVLLLFAFCACAPQEASNTDTSKTIQSIQNKGSDTMVNLALAWAEQYQKEHANVRLSVTGGGSGTGFAALMNATTDIANASRTIQSQELDQARKNNFTPVEFVVARDAIAVIVNPSNPVQKLSLKQISNIYRGVINNWKELGGEDRPIVRLSRETNSGTHVYFLETVIRLGDKKDKTIFSPDTLLLPSSEGIISEVRDNPNAIGYDGLGYITPEVKSVAIAKIEGGQFILPSVETVNNNTYPVSRDLYMYTRNQPLGAVKDYLEWIISPEAQKIVIDLGFVPLKTTK